MDNWLDLLTSPQAWAALASLTALEIVLGIDNIVFIAILTDRLPVAQRSLAYRLGLGAAALSRIALLFALNWVRSLSGEVLNIWGNSFSARDFVLLGGGLVLIGKSTSEMFAKVQGLQKPDAPQSIPAPGGVKTRLWGVLGQIMVLDLVFSLDSVITAVGVAEHVEVMVVAIVISVLMMLLFAEKVGHFVNAYPSLKILALAFLLTIGVLLTAEAFDQHIDKKTIYFAMAFALAIEFLNMRYRKTTAGKSER